MRANRGIPRDLEGEGKRLNRGQSAFWRKGDVMVQVWRDKRLVRAISTIHDATIVNTGRKYRKTKMEIKKPYAIVQYNEFIKGVDRADQYLSYLENSKRCLYDTAVFIAGFTHYEVWMDFDWKSNG
jgi:hypothetical protein